MQDSDNDYHATRIIMALADEILDIGHCICIDNRYTSVEICDVLNKRSTDIIGTLRRNRKGLPDVVTKQ